MSKTRLDLYMAENGLAESRSMAQRMIMAGSVRINGQVALKAADSINDTDIVSVDKPPLFVSRGGEKLLGALTAFHKENLNEYVCVDVGASTGGFTDCLLQHGARKVYTVDVGYGILHWKLRKDPRVVVMEKTNARFIERYPEKIDLVTIDASFISLRTLLPVIKKWFDPGKGEIIALIKPQFEAGKREAAKGEGVIRDPLVHRRILLEVLSTIEDLDFQINGLIQSPLTGPKGNIEFLVHLVNRQGKVKEVRQWVDEVIPENPG